MDRNVFCARKTIKRRYTIDRGVRTYIDPSPYGTLPTRPLNSKLRRLIQGARRRRHRLRDELGHMLDSLGKKPAGGRV